MDSGHVCVVLCCYKLDDSALKKFLDMNREVFNRHDVHVCVSSDRERVAFDSPTVKILKYPVDQKVFNFSRTLNFGIRNSLEYDIIVKTDIDIIFSDETIEKILAEVNEGNGVICHSAHVPAYEDAVKAMPFWPSKYKIQTTGLGACFAMHRTCWEKLEGYNEQLEGWGYEDIDLYHRAGEVCKITRSNETAVYHVRHDGRQGKFFPWKLKLNKEISHTRVYVNSNWGRPGPS